MQERSTRCGLLAGIALMLAATAAPAQKRRERSWNEEKCARYTAAWHEALSRLGRDGLGAGFVAAHEAFLAAACRGPRRVCPRSEAELRMADAMTAAAVNARIAGSFLPFGCQSGRAPPGDAGTAFLAAPASPAPRMITGRERLS